MNSLVVNGFSGFIVCVLLDCIFIKGECGFIVFLLFFIVVILFFGNIFILIVILFFFKCWNFFNLLIFNLVVLDFFIMIFCIFFVILDLYVFGYNWIYGLIMCCLVFFV